jgi:hypothetical protein
MGCIAHEEVSTEGYESDATKCRFLCEKSALRALAARREVSNMTQYPNVHHHQVVGESPLAIAAIFLV